MSARSYRFSVGSFECVVLLDGASVLGSTGISRRFPGVAEAEAHQAYTDIGRSLDEADDSFNILLVKIGTETILIDTGEGGRPGGGLLPASLTLAGIAPESITQIIITHAHDDHVLGLLSTEMEPVFPNARYIITRDEMVSWQGRTEGRSADQRPIIALMEAQGLHLIDMDTQIMPGVTPVPLPGHTPGQIGLLFESEGARLLHLTDVLHSLMQFAHPEWSATFDLDTQRSVPTRRAALQRAADEDLLTLFYHMTFPGLGHIRQAEQGFTWEPLVMQS